MPYEIIIGIAIVLVILVVLSKKEKDKKGLPENIEVEQNKEVGQNKEIEQNKNVSAIGKYKNKWLFSYNEKDAYKKIKEITDKHGLYLFAKVRLLDLIEPITGIKQYKTYFYKIQAKHVDFVICDSKLVAKCIIELDDNSHQSKDRKERDTFVDEALTSAGYQIIHIISASTEDLEAKILTTCKIEIPSAT